MNIKTLSNFNLFGLLMIALVLGACGGGSGTQVVENNEPQEDNAADENPEANQGTYALQIKTAEEYYNTLLELTGLSPTTRIRRFNNQEGGGDEEIRDAYNVALAGLLKSSNPAETTGGSAKDIVGLASAFCQEASLENSVRRGLFDEESIFWASIGDSDYDEFLTKQEVYDEVFDAFADAYWAGQVTLKANGSALPFYETTKDEVQILVNELAAEKPGDVSNTEMMRTLMVTVCTSVLASANVYLH